MKFILIAAAMFAGCVKTGVVPAETSHDSSKARYLCVGMETSLRFGSCPGCEIDAKRLASLMKTKMGYEGETLISGQATKEAVVRSLKRGVENTPEDGIFLFFYSGHGGQEYLGGKEPDGADREDEYLCLYDAHMLDDEIWEIVSRCRGRIFMYFDACHSATMYRSVSQVTKAGNGSAKALGLHGESLVMSKGFTFRPERFSVARAQDLTLDKGTRILCWSGCKEAEYSYGGKSGGALTTSVINNWKSGLSYDSLWSSVYKSVNKSQPTQHPVQTYVGSFDRNTEAFR